MTPEEMRDDIPVDLWPALSRAVEMLMEAGEAHAAEDLKSALRPKPRTVHLPAAELPAPLEEVPGGGKVWTVGGSSKTGVWLTSFARDAVKSGFAFATRADAEAWLAHIQSWKSPRPGDDWTPHTPGDSMPCDGEALVNVRFRDGDTSTHAAKVWEWAHIKYDHKAEITAWRYAREDEA